MPERKRSIKKLLTGDYKYDFLNVRDWDESFSPRAVLFDTVIDLGASIGMGVGGPIAHFGALSPFLLVVS